MLISNSKLLPQEAASAFITSSKEVLFGASVFWLEIKSFTTSLLRASKVINKNAVAFALSSCFQNFTEMLAGSWNGETVEFASGKDIRVRAYLSIVGEGSLFIHRVWVRQNNNTT